MAGKFNPEVLQQLQALLKNSTSGSQVMLLERWLEDEEINEMIQAADFISVTYAQHFANASILFRAIQAGKNALISDSGWLGRFSGRYCYGVKIKINSPEDYAYGIRKLFAQERFSIPFASVEKNTEDNFTNTLREK